MPERSGFNLEGNSSSSSTIWRRLALSVGMFAVSAPVVSLTAAAVWWGFYLACEGWLWAASSPKALRRRPSARIQRLCASFLGSAAWVVIAMLHWGVDRPAPRLLAAALLCGILIYTVRVCHRSVAHMAMSALPPAACMLILPFAYADRPVEFLALEGVMVMLIAFIAGSGASAHRSHRRLVVAAEALTRGRDAAEAASRAKSDFLANMSHEVRTPLNGVMGVAAALSQTSLSREQRELVGLIQTSARTLEVLVSDVLDLTKVESGRLRLTAEPFDAAAVAQSCADLFRDTIQTKGLGFSVTVASQSRRLVTGDAARLRQILCNLLSNAAKFTENGEVRLVIEAEPAAENLGLLFRVTDTGIGFGAAEAQRLFERYEQADGSITARFGGTGLGLAISKSLARMMGGDLTAVSAPGEGATFELRLVLPLCRAQPVIRAAKATGPEVEISGLQVLVAEDHPTNRRVVELILGAAGVEITCVENGLEAVEIVRKRSFDLILMDMQMPVMDGLTAIREIRALACGAGTPIYTLSANAMPEHADAALEAGADGHVTKPVRAAQLLEIAAIAARQRRPAEAESARVA